MTPLPWSFPQWWNDGTRPSVASRAVFTGQSSVTMNVRVMLVYIRKGDADKAAKYACAAASTARRIAGLLGREL